MNKCISDIMDIMNEIEYGYKDENGINIIDDNNLWTSVYHLLNKEELLEKKCGICWDQVELERYLFSKENIKVETYFICIYDDEKCPTHTFLTYCNDNKYYWFEHSWEVYRGVHEYSSKKELLLDVKQKFIEFNSYEQDNINTFMYKYEKPKEHINVDDFYRYVETGELIKLNEPLYFYHIVNKNADMSNGLISLKYMYDNKMFELFDKNIKKYKERITNSWNIEKYKGKTSLTREEYIDGLNIFRGEYGSSYIYFFKYPPYGKLGSRMKEILKYKDIYRINIHDEEILKNIKDIFYGYDMSNSNNKQLDENYYKSVTQDEYFSKYDDNLEMNFSTLNHIGIAFISDNCPLEFLEKIN